MSSAPSHPLLSCLRKSTAAKALLIMAGLFITGCVSFSKSAAMPLSERHQPSRTRVVVGEDLSFERYVARARQHIIQSRVDLTPQNRDAIPTGNSPFDLRPKETCPTGKGKPYRRGVLLTHGLTDSPYSVRALGQFFQAHCFRVMAILLPGHGTRPGDLLGVSWQDWAETEAFGAKALAAEVDEVYLAGFSTGGALSVYESLRDPNVAGLFLFAPAIQITSLAAMANWHKAYSWLVPRARWGDIRNDDDPFKYNSFPLNGADQVHLLTKEIHAHLAKKEIAVPVFVAASLDDATVKTAGTLAFFKRTLNPLNRMILYSAEAASFPMIDRIEVVNSRFPEQRIISSAHTAIVVPPSDPHYGAEGAAVGCEHYFDDDPAKYARCKSKNEDFRGEISDANLAQGVVRRLTYNPNFDMLKVSLEQFIDTLP